MERKGKVISSHEPADSGLMALCQTCQLPLYCQNGCTGQITFLGGHEAGAIDENGYCITCGRPAVCARGHEVGEEESVPFFGKIRRADQLTFEEGRP